MFNFWTNGENDTESEKDPLKWVRDSKTTDELPRNWIWLVILALKEIIRQLDAAKENKDK